MKRTTEFLIYPLVIMGVCFMLTCSCKKGGSDTNPTQTTTSSKKLQSINYSNGNIETFEYNSDGKISKITGDEYGESDYTYTYSGNNITCNNYNHKDGTLMGTEVSTLNSQGYISKTTGSYGSQNYVENYEYDNSGYLTKGTFSDGIDNELIIYTYTNGNMTSEHFTNANNDNFTTYEYYLDKKNTIGNEYQGIKFLVKSNTNLIKTENPGSSNVITYTYEFDQNNYVTKMTKTSSNGTSTWETYIYK